MCRPCPSDNMMAAEQFRAHSPSPEWEMRHIQHQCLHLFFFFLLVLGNMQIQSSTRVCHQEFSFPRPECLLVIQNSVRLAGVYDAAVTIGQSGAICGQNIFIYKNKIRYKKIKVNKYFPRWTDGWTTTGKGRTLRDRHAAADCAARRGLLSANFGLLGRIAAGRTVSSNQFCPLDKSHLSYTKG